eukprot:9500344-Pyramimonas_sp.AAC.1
MLRVQRWRGPDWTRLFESKTNTANDNINSDVGGVGESNPQRKCVRVRNFGSRTALPLQRPCAQVAELRRQMASADKRARDAAAKDRAAAFVRRTPSSPGKATEETRIMRMRWDRT